ncbi:MAG: SMC-Scp complex subunit ScpB [Clostridium perfringens]|nr:SMC-Scp complex subunit ScpB [Clostridium perfringens]
MDINQVEFEEVSRKNAVISAIESLLFAAGEPLSARDISKILYDDLEFIKDVLNEMVERYNKTNSRGIKLIVLNNMYQLVTKPCNSEYVQRLLKKNIRQSLSQASLESLAIIAYKQPITRVEIDEIRGVKSESAIQRLVEKGLIEETGRLDVIGRPILYGTTNEFLRHFALNDLNELPSIDLFNDDEEREDRERED